MKNLKYLVIGLVAFAIVGVTGVSAAAYVDEDTMPADSAYIGWYPNTTVEEKEGVYYVTMGANITTDFIIQSGEEVVLDLNGFTLQNFTLATEAIKVLEGGKLTIVDNSQDGDGKVIHQSGSTYGVITNQGTLIIEGGNYEISDNFYIIRNEAEMTINGGTFKSTSGTSMIGNMRSTDQSGTELADNDVYPELTINGGTFTSDDTVLINYANSTIEVNGGTFTSANEYALDNSGAATINNGTFESETTSAIFLNKDASKDTVALSLAITGGKITSADSVESDIVLYADGAPTTANSDVVAITGGSFSTDVSGLLGEGYEVDESGNVVKKEETVLPPVEEDPNENLGDSNTPDTTPSEEIPAVPQTFDALGMYVGVGAISLAAIAGAVIYLKRRA